MTIPDTISEAQADCLGMHVAHYERQNDNTRASLLGAKR